MSRAMRSLQWAALAAAVASVISAAPARAELTGCLANASGLTCSAPVACDVDEDCAAGERCVRGQTGAPRGVCIPDCTDIFACGSDSDCPVVDGVVGTCRRTGIAGAGSGLCEFVPVDPGEGRLLTYCFGSGPLGLSRVLQCVHAGSWATGDCDGDMIANADDLFPCGDGTPGRVVSYDPFCERIQICHGTDGVCLPRTTCHEGSTFCAERGASLGDPEWECSPIPNASPEPICHPHCDTTAHCENDSDCPPDARCLPSPMGNGLCVSNGLDACLASVCPDDPLAWASPDGDCDGDGVSNTCDLDACDSSLATPLCTYAPCATPDAGVEVDAGVPGDAGSDDAGSGPDASEDSDAGSGLDASAAMDGGTTTAPPGVSFGGGGGCRCVAVRARAPGLSLWASLALLALVMWRRATRR